ncbi:MAG: hypothetical protein ACI4EL_06375 [Candidatus Fimimorpha sp.]
MVINSLLVDGSLIRQQGIHQHQQRLHLCYSLNQNRIHQVTVKGKFGAYCKNKCGMNVGKAMGTMLSDTQIKSILEGKRFL